MLADDSATPWASPSARKIPVSALSSGVVPRSETPPSTRRYQLVLKIASGGMGAVYLGFQTGAAGFRRPVAIKRAHAHLAEDPEFRRMIINEGRLASLVRHPNVVSVCDVEDVDGELFLVMDYVEGATLAELMVSERPMPLCLTLRILADACRGLDALHSAVDDRGIPLGLVHRDVSPQNIIVGVDGVTRIADFGIAKVCEGTVSGLLRGKPAYMAPEYIATGDASPASDLFGLGVVAWECLARRRLFRGANDIETLDNVRHATIPPASAFAPHVPPGVERAIMKALARRTSERFESARELGDALDAVSGNSTVFARPEAVGTFVQGIVREKLELRRRALVEETPPRAEIRPLDARSSGTTVPHGSVPPCSADPTRVELGSVHVPEDDVEPSAPRALIAHLRQSARPARPVALAFAVGVTFLVAALGLLRSTTATESARKDSPMTELESAAPSASESMGTSLR